MVIYWSKVKSTGTFAARGRSARKLSSPHSFESIDKALQYHYLGQDCLSNMERPFLHLKVAKGKRAGPLDYQKIDQQKWERGKIR